jgi:dTMP kinase
MSNVGQARFITLEGGEGAGKSTQIKLLAAHLQSLGLDVLTTREPEGPIRDLLVNGYAEWKPQSEALLHFAARFEHLSNVVRPALAAGRWVVCDRFADSSMAYQGIVQGAGAGFVNELYQLVVGDFAPDLTLVLDLPVEIGLVRASARGEGEDRYERMGTAFHTQLRQAFVDIVRMNEDRCRLIDANQSIEGVSSQIWSTVADRFGLS